MNKKQIMFNMQFNNRKRSAKKHSLIFSPGKKNKNIDESHEVSLLLKHLIY
jgi:hypothetical protein